MEGKYGEGETSESAKNRRELKKIEREDKKLINRIHIFKIVLLDYIKQQDKVYCYPDASERRNDVQTDIDQIVYEVMQKYYIK